MPNPTLKRHLPATLPPRMADAWRHSMALRGDATFFEVFGNNPELYAWYRERFYGELFNAGCCERRAKEILRLRLSSVHGCRFCNQGNRVAAADAGLVASEIEAVAAGDGAALTPRDRAVLALAEQMLLTNPAGALDAELHAALHEHYDDAQILELGVVAAVLTGMAKMLFVFDLVEKEASCPFPHLAEPV